MHDRGGSKNADCSQEVYDRYCHELDKEDKLLSDRVNWLLLSQSILFAAVGLAAGGVGEAVARVVPYVGIALSAAILLSVIAAVTSYWRYKGSLEAACPPSRDREGAYPQLHREKGVLWLGLMAPLLLPALFIVAWTFLIIVR